MWFQRKHYLIFFLKPTWLPNHVTYQLEINKHVKACLGESVGEFLPQSVQPFWRRRFLKFINFQSKIADEPYDLWHHKFTSCLQSCSGIRVWSFVFIGKGAFFSPRRPPNHGTCDILIFNVYAGMGVDYSGQVSLRKVMWFQRKHYLI